MCTRYISPADREIEAFWEVSRRTPLSWERELFPLRTGPFIRRARDDVGFSRELALGQWGMIPPWSATRIPQSKPRTPGEKPRRLSTVNARSEELERKETFREAWQRGQRCIVPAERFFEPNWESGANVWWQFRRADGAPWGVAGLWSVWHDRSTDEEVDNYTMLTLNADAHPLMRRMHRPAIDPRTKVPLPPERQDKRSLVLLEQQDFDRWLAGTIEEARALVRLTPVEVFDAGPADSALPPESPELERT